MNKKIEPTKKRVKELTCKSYRVGGVSEKDLIKCERTTRGIQHTNHCLKEKELKAQYKGGKIAWNAEKQI